MTFLHRIPWWLFTLLGITLSICAGTGDTIVGTLGSKYFALGAGTSFGLGVGAVVVQRKQS